MEWPTHLLLVGGGGVSNYQEVWTEIEYQLVKFGQIEVGLVKLDVL